MGGVLATNIPKFRMQPLFIEPHVKSMQLESPVICRRHLFGLFSGMTTSLLFGDFLFLCAKRSAGTGGFAIINGWVLTQEEAAASKAAGHAVRL